MARENQGLQIALIIFVMLTIILGVTTFLFYKQFQEQAIARAEADKVAEEQKSAAATIQTDYNDLKEKSGFAMTATADSIGDDYGADKELYMGNLPEGQHTYRAALADQFNALTRKGESLTDATADNVALKKQIEDLERSKRPLIDAEKARADTAVANLDQAKTAYNDARSALTQQQGTQYNTYVQKEQQAVQAQQNLNAQIALHQGRIEELQELIDTKNKKIIEIIEPTFEMADGKIRWVNQRNRTVWIDLGRADALQRLTSFSVFPSDTNDVSKGGKKASIEVTQVLGDHLSECTITDDEYGDPIMPGDVIHTPVWAPGEREHFALSGGMDIDGDGKSDLATVRRIITMNGGVVDCYVSNEGQFEGDFTNSTRYLVMGDKPDETSSEAVLTAHREIINRADGLGVMPITLKALLDKMGWKNQAPVVRFGRDGNPNDFRVQPPDGGPKVSTGEISPIFKPPAGGPKVSTGEVSPLFRPRSAPRTSRGSAY